jgi:exosome complex RNA-binding protein Rrp42 (RNase PH superfamily)
VTAAAAAAAAAAATVGVGTSQEGGHVELELGETRVLAIASIEAVAPFPDRPNEGMFKL